MVSGKTFATAAAAAGTLVSTLALTALGSANAHEDSNGFRAYGQGRFVALNNSGVEGKAEVFVKGHHAYVEYFARGLSPSLPHAAHLHHSEDARNECPTFLDDANGDFRLSTLEGAPAYGEIQKSLTVTGDTSPASALDLARFPVAGGEGKVYYKRSIRITHELAMDIKDGEVAVVVHGADYNGDGVYDFESAGASELNSEVPAEATDPVACTIL